MLYYTSHDRVDCTEDEGDVLVAVEVTETGEDVVESFQALPKGCDSTDISQKIFVL